MQYITPNGTNQNTKPFTLFFFLKSLLTLHTLQCWRVAVVLLPSVTAHQTFSRYMQPPYPLPYNERIQFARRTAVKQDFHLHQAASIALSASKVAGLHNHHDAHVRQASCVIFLAKCYL